MSGEPMAQPQNKVALFDQDDATLPVSDAKHPDAVRHVASRDRKFSVVRSGDRTDSPGKFPVKLLMLACCVAMIAAALQGTGGFKDTLTSLAVVMVVLAVALQMLILVFRLPHHRQQALTRSQDTRLHISPLVSIIMPACNEGEVIRAALKNILQLSYPNYEIILIDDGSVDDTYDIALSMVPEAGGRLRVFRQQSAGKAVALNLGLRISRSPFVLCVDAYSKMAADGLEHAVRHFRSPSVAAVAGVVEARQSAVANRWLPRWQCVEYAMPDRLRRAAAAYFKTIPITPGSAAMFRRKALEQVGGYRSAQRSSAEDAELSNRLLAAGHDIVCEPGLISVNEPPVN